MKKLIKSTCYVLAVCTVGLFSNCSKKPSDITLPTVNPDIVDAMYPVTQSFSNGAYSYVFNYSYDKDMNLVKYGRGDELEVIDIGTNQVDHTLYSKSPDMQSVTSYLFTLAGAPNTSVNIYKTTPTQVSWTYFYKYLQSGATKSEKGSEWQFFTNTDGLVVKAITSAGGGKNTLYTYDDKKNLKMVEYVNLTGPRADAVSQRMTITSVDDKHSPFSGVKGYWVASYPHAYPWNIALAFFKNNPIQMISEEWDNTKGGWKVFQKDDFTYRYNDKGYPTAISVNTTYVSSNTWSTSTTYYYTYK